MGWIRFLATGCGAGLLRPAPGTWGTLVGIPLVWLFALADPYGYMVAAIALVFLGVWICDLYEARGGAHDSSEVVIDEVAGFVITMTWLPLDSWKVWLAGFLLFRLLDITKPLVIGQIDRRMKGGFGVMMDDVLAGVIANFILQVVYLKTDWLGVQWHS